ncbi:MAG: hypothetical protein IJO50_04180 [Clostridia bacterium]|nr:hypothetical protein [Clostridia bacterium]
MKKYLNLFLMLPALLYLVLYLPKIQSIAAMHLDLQTVLPIIFIIIGILMMLTTALLKLYRYTLTGAVYLVCGIITYIVASPTPCCIGG